MESTADEFDAKLMELVEAMTKTSAENTENAEKMGDASEKEEKGGEGEMIRRFERVEHLVQANGVILRNLLAGESDTKNNERKAVLEVLEEVRRRLTVEAANEKLFDRMHQELKSYRDEFLYDTMHKPVIRDLLGMLDVLDGLLKTTEKEEVSAVLHGNLDNLKAMLLETLIRIGVEEIECAENQFDVRNHRMLETLPAENQEQDGKIAEVVRSGFRWRNRVIRPIDVKVFRYTTNTTNEAAGTPSTDETSGTDENATQTIEKEDTAPEAEQVVSFEQSPEVEQTD